jgi:hypothetical protein
MQIDHILAEAHQHLGRGLVPDAAINVRLAGKYSSSFHKSVIESPKNTTRFSPTAGGFKLTLASR